ncbi:MAG TPA: HAMP domain-containing sensor histidine kinase, partial [Longimicrobiales bacterium]|nr:HAMP domain-containing sensor histidine kinase [Longimicrobiales bacterium]
DYSRRRDPRRVETDLTALVRGVADFLDGEAAKVGARIEVEPPGRDVRCAVDPDLLHQVFLNLLLNALHAVEESEEPRRIRVGLRSDEDGAVVAEVADSGPGIPPDARDRVFDPFFTTKAGSRGTGLGLAVARGIVEDHGGTVELLPAADPGTGARFRITLPPAEPTDDV